MLFLAVMYQVWIHLKVDIIRMDNKRLLVAQIITMDNTWILHSLMKRLSFLSLPVHQDVFLGSSGLESGLAVQFHMALIMQFV
jgi:hypothetical protein